VIWSHDVILRLSVDRKWKERAVTRKTAVHGVVTDAESNIATDV